MSPRPSAPGWKELRERTGLTIRGLEELTGINRGEISRIERSRTCPTPDQARRLLAILDGDAGALALDATEPVG